MNTPQSRPETDPTEPGHGAIVFGARIVAYEPTGVAWAVDYGTPVTRQHVDHQVVPALTTRLDS